MQMQNCSATACTVPVPLAATLECCIRIFAILVGREDVTLSEKVMRAELQCQWMLSAGEHADKLG